MYSKWKKADINGYSIGLFHLYDILDKEQL